MINACCASLPLAALSSYDSYFEYTNAAAVRVSGGYALISGLHQVA
jgi:hypothetical protein